MTDFPNLDPKDLRIFTFSTNHNTYAIKADNGVHIIHLPTGLEAREFNSKSQHANKHIAMIKLNDQVGSKTKRQAEFNFSQLIQE